MLHKNKTFNLLLRFFRKEVTLGATPLSLCLKLIHNKKSSGDDVDQFFESMTTAERHYWIGNVYASLLPSAKRKKMAIFFTPPHLSDYTINRLCEFGVDISTTKYLDPASGGAAFLTPLAAAIIEKLKESGRSDKEIGLHLCANLAGIEIDGELSGLSKKMLENLLSLEIPQHERNLHEIIINADALSFRIPAGGYDVVIGNPPYGRIKKPSKTLYARFGHILTYKHVNNYSLFIELAIDAVRPGGFVAMLVPTSFIAGPLFGDLRVSILKNCNILAIDLIQKRADVFFDVLQDACLLILQKKADNISVHLPTSRLIFEDGTSTLLGSIDIPRIPIARPWVMPSETCQGLLTRDFFSDSFSTLEDYGYGVRAGYFVWNREKKRYREATKPKQNEIPLIWAHCIKPNKSCMFGTHRVWGNPAPKISFVSFNNASPAIVREPAVILQRTTCKNQPSRLIAGYVTKKQIAKYGGVITENHTIILYPLPHKKQLLDIKQMCKLLNAKPVDSRFRQVSGTVSVSVMTLRMLPLPKPNILLNKFKDLSKSTNIDDLVESCYPKPTRGGNE